MRISQAFPISCSALLLAILSSTPSVVRAADDDVPTLRYNWRQGKTYAYSVRIDVINGNVQETVKGTSGYEVLSADDGGFKLRHFGELTIDTEETTGPANNRKTTRTTRQERPTVTQFMLDTDGAIVRAKGDPQLPFMLGNLSTLIIDPLPQAGTSKWEQESDCVIREKQTVFRMPALPQGTRQLPPLFNPIRPPQPLIPNPVRPPLGGIPQPVRPPMIRPPQPINPLRPPQPVAPQPVPAERTVEHEARESSQYTLQKRDGDIVPIEKKYELKTLDDAEPVTLRLNGKALTRFSVKQGLPVSMTFDGTISGKSVRETVRIKVAITLLEGEKAEQALVSARKVPAPPPVATPMPNANADNGEIDALIASLKSGDKDRIKTAAKRLTDRRATERQKEIAEALMAEFASKDIFVKQQVFAAMKNYVSEDNSNALIVLARDNDIFARHNALKLLALLPLNDERGEVLGKGMSQGLDRGMLLGLMKEIGTKSEPVLLKYHGCKDDRQRIEVAKILAEIGTDKSKKLLEEWQKSGSDDLAGAAFAGLRGIARRTNDN